MGTRLTPVAKPVDTKKAPAIKKAPDEKALRPAFMETSDEATMSGAVVFVHAPQGFGKSTLSVTVSEQCPWPLPAKKKTIVDDIFYLGADSKATVGFRSLNIGVANLLDLGLLRSREDRWRAAGFKQAPTCSEALHFALDEAEKWCQARPATARGHFVLDTASKIDSDYWVEFDQGNGIQTAGMILQQTRFMHDRILNMGFETIIYLAHDKALMEFDGAMAGKNADVVKKAGKSLEGARIVPAITGQSVGVFNRDAILELSIDAPRDPGTRRRKRWVYTVPHEGKECKNRFEAALDEKEEPNLRLILQKALNFKP